MERCQICKSRGPGYAVTDQSQIILVLAAFFSGGKMQSYISGLNWLTLSSETERRERERREGSRTRSPLCNGDRLSPNLMVSTLSLMNLTQKG